MIGTHLDRRTFLRRSGQGAAAATMATAGVQTTAADDDNGDNDDDDADPDEPDIVEYPGANPIDARLNALNSTFGMLADINSSPLADRTVLHSMAVNESQTAAAFEILIGNHLQDTPTVASIEARHGIALAYEDGQSESSAYETALTRIRRYYGEVIEHNLIEAVNKSLLQFSHIRNSGKETDPEFSISAGGEDDADEFAQIHISAERTTSTVTRHDGEEHEVGSGLDEDDDEIDTDELTPLLKVYDGDFHDSETEVIGTVPMLSDEVIDGYDETEGEFTFEVEDDDGETEQISSNLAFTIPSVGSEESQMVLFYSEFAELLEEIKDQSDNVVANYDASFIGDIYGLFDDGTISPSDVRGSEGLARFLTGTDDASADRFRMALMQQLEMSYADLSEIASQEIVYTGETSMGQESEVGEVQEDWAVVLEDFEEDREMEGMLFARDIGDGLTAGDVAYVNENEYYLYSVDEVVVALHPETAEAEEDDDVVWRWTGASDDLDYVEFDQTGRYVFALEGWESLFVLDADTGEELYEYDAIPGGGYMLAEGGGYAFVGGRDGHLAKVDPVEQEEVWRIKLRDGDDGNVDGVAATYDGEYIAAATSDTLALVDSEGDEIFSLEESGTITSLHIDQDREQVYRNGLNTNNDTPFKTFDFDGEHVWTYDDVVETSSHEGVVGRDGRIFITRSEETLAELYPDDGEEIASHDVGRRLYNLQWDYRRDIIISADNDDRMSAYDPDNGDLLWQLQPEDGTFPDDVASPAVPNADEYLDGATFYDAPNGESVTLARGQFELVRATDRDGNEVDIEGDDWGEPEYAQFDSAEWAEYIESLEEYQESMQADSTVTVSGGLGDLWDRLTGSMLGIPMWAWAAAAAGGGVVALSSIRGR